MKNLKISLFAVTLLAVIPALQFGMSKVIDGHTVMVTTGAASTDGTSYTAGSTTMNGVQYMALARYGADGAPDKTFGAGGLVIGSIGANSTANAITIQPDGKILVEGTSADGAFKARYNSNGMLDTTFGTNGIETKAVSK